MAVIDQKLRKTEKSRNIRCDAHNFLKKPEKAFKAWAQLTRNVPKRANFY